MQPWISAASAERQQWAAQFGELATVEPLESLLDQLLTAAYGEITMLIIDCHGHYTTAPDAHQKFRDQQLAHI